MTKASAVLNEYKKRNFESRRTVATRRYFVSSRVKTRSDEHRDGGRQRRKRVRHAVGGKGTLPIERSIHPGRGGSGSDRVRWTGRRGEDGRAP